MTRPRRIATLLCSALFLISTAALSHEAGTLMPEAEAAVARADYVKAADLFTAECAAGGPLGCYNLAIFEYEGKLAPPDRAKAARLNRRACDLGLPDGCANLAAQILDGDNSRKNLEEARALLERACDAGSASGCNSLSLVEDGFYGDTPDLLAATSAAERACALKSGDACYRLGYRAAQQSEWEKAEHWYRAACHNAHDGAGCNALGAMAAAGDGRPRNVAAAGHYFSLGCGLRNEAACNNLSTLAGNNEPRPADKNRRGPHEL